MRPRSVRWLLVQGILAPLFYAAAAVAGGYLHPGYSHFDQAVSELAAAGAVNQGWLLAAFALTEVMTLGFAIGFCRAVRGDAGALRASALVLGAIGVIGLGFARFPMDPVGAPITLDGRMHLAIVSVSAVLAIAAVALSALGWRRVGAGRAMSRLSFASLAVMLVAGVLSGLAVAQGWPGIGLWQRVNVGAFGIWQIGTAVHLLRRT